MLAVQSHPGTMATVGFIGIGNMGVSVAGRAVVAPCETMCEVWK